MMPRRSMAALLGTSLLAALIVALILVAQPPSSGAGNVALPPLSTEELLNSARTALPKPVAATVTVDERFGLFALGPAPDNGPRTARLWFDGTGRRRVSLPFGGGERTIVNDGTTVWSWDSTSRSVTRSPASDLPAGDPRQLARFAGSELLGNPVDATHALLTLLAAASVPRLDPPDTVAGRPAYELVLQPQPTERTLLREVRVALDGQTHMPLSLTVLANGSAQPALRLAFTELTFGPQPATLFQFRPPPGAKVTVHSARLASAPEKNRLAHDSHEQATLIGEGWDTVLVRRLCRTDASGASLTPAALNQLSTQIRGPWGHGRLIHTDVGNAVVTSDGRLAVGAVPAQVITEALAR
jgi:outer membrane lipoprotein-sorting protein